MIICPLCNTPFASPEDPEALKAEITALRNALQFERERNENAVEGWAQSEKNAQYWHRQYQHWREGFAKTWGDTARGLVTHSDLVLTGPAFVADIDTAYQRAMATQPGPRKGAP